MNEAEYVWRANVLVQAVDALGKLLEQLESPTLATLLRAEEAVEALEKLNIRIRHEMADREQRSTWRSKHAAD